MNAKSLATIFLVLVTASAFAQQPNSGFAQMTINGVNGPPFPIVNVPVRTNLPATFGFLGAGNQPYAIFQTGAIAVGSAFCPSSNSLNSVDLSLTPFPVKVIDGFANPAFSTGAGGVGGFSLTLPPPGNPPTGVPLGLQLSLQSIVADPFSSIGATLTAATLVVVTQGPTITNINLQGAAASYAIDVSSMPMPFYGVNYNTLHVASNGYITFGSPSSDFTPTAAEFIASPPRMAAFWTALNQLGGTVTVTVDTPQMAGTIPGYVRVDFNNVQGAFGVGTFHSFSMLARTDGYLELIYPPNQNTSAYDTISGIGPGNNVSQPQKNFAGPQPLGSFVGNGILTTSPFFLQGGVNENFFEWFGLINGSMPYYGNPYNNPYDLFARTIRFQPSGSGVLPGSTHAYTCF